MLLRSNTGHWLEPVGIVGCTLFQRPFLHGTGNYIRNLVRFSASTGNSIEIVTHDGAKFVCFIDEEGESDKVVTNEFDTELLDLLFDEESENREGTEQKVLEYVNGMKYTVDNEERGEAVA